MVVDIPETAEAAAATVLTKELGTLAEVVPAAIQGMVLTTVADI
jgi:hypothetical protein